jgi:hypothetical protein
MFDNAEISGSRQPVSANPHGTRQVASGKPGAAQVGKSEAVRRGMESTK